MLLIPSVFKPSIFGDEVILNSVDWLENFPWKQDNALRVEKDKYEVCLHLKDFGPTEISVKIVDGFLIIEGKHDEKKDEHGYISRHFTRKYSLPEDCITEKVESKLSADGVLTITAPRTQVVRRDTLIPVEHENSKPKSKL